MTAIVCGIDEVGRGPLAGPVVAAAVVLARPIDGLADSKTLPAARREALAALITQSARLGVGAASAREIDRFNIEKATFLAMQRAVVRLRLDADTRGIFLVDGNRAPVLPGEVRCIVGGDGIEPAISAASIVAKVMRDRLMARLALRYPAFGFAHNAGYGTAAHRAALTAAGPCPHHRRSFAPVRQMLHDLDR